MACHKALEKANGTFVKNTLLEMELGIQMVLPGCSHRIYRKGTTFKLLSSMTKRTVSFT